MPDVDQQNAAYWNELCGSGMARALGIDAVTPESLKRFDDAYLAYYPYLLAHVQPDQLAGRQVLEVGLGYGTLGQHLAAAGADYTGLDIAAGPVAMLNDRLRLAGLPGRAIQGSVLACPLPDASQDAVVSIGCLHHTGNLQRAFDEVHRVLKPGGTAVLMVYSKFSYRQWLRWPGTTLAALVGSSKDALDAQRHAYDHDASGAGAPETLFVSARELRAMLKSFRHVAITRENNGPFTVRGRTLVSREALLPVVGRFAGLDLYVRVTK